MPATIITIGNNLDPNTQSARASRGGGVTFVTQDTACTLSSNNNNIISGNIGANACTHIVLTGIPANTTITYDISPQTSSASRTEKQGPTGNTGNTILVTS